MNKVSLDTIQNCPYPYIKPKKKHHQNRGKFKQSKTYEFIINVKYEELELKKLKNQQMLEDIKKDFEDEEDDEDEYGD